MSRPRVTPGERFDLAAHETRVEPGADPALEVLREQLTDLSERVAAEASRALLVVLQGFDGAGKDEVITTVLTAVDPAYLHVFSFKQGRRRGSRPRLPVALAPVDARARQGPRVRSLVGADDRDGARAAVAALLVEALDPQFPPIDPDALEEAGISGPDDV